MYEYVFFFIVCICVTSFSAVKQIIEIKINEEYMCYAANVKKIIYYKKYNNIFPLLKTFLLNQEFSKRYALNSCDVYNGAMNQLLRRIISRFLNICMQKIT